MIRASAEFCSCQRDTAGRTRRFRLGVSWYVYRMERDYRHRDVFDSFFSLLALFRLERQRRINEGDPLFLSPAAKVELLALIELDAEGRLGEELKMGMPSIVRHTADVSAKNWTNAVDVLLRYGLAETYEDTLRVSAAGKRYAWRKYRGDLNIILLRAAERDTRARP